MGRFPDWNKGGGYWAVDPMPTGAEGGAEDGIIQNDESESESVNISCQYDKKSTRDESGIYRRPHPYASSESACSPEGTLKKRKGYFVHHDTLRPSSWTFGARTRNLAERLQMPQAGLFYRACLRGHSKIRQMNQMGPAESSNRSNVKTNE